SVTVVPAAGSATHRVPLMTNAYWCTPRLMGTDTVQIPSEPVCGSSVAVRCQLLKSPTSATLAAPGAMNTKRTMCTVSVRAGASAVATGCAVGDTAAPAPPGARSATAPRTATVASPAASASPTTG